MRPCPSPGQAEFNEEQQYLQTLSYLSRQEQEKYKERQSVSFMYQKPPGLDAVMAREAAEKKKVPPRPPPSPPSPKP